MSIENKGPYKNEDTMGFREDWKGGDEKLSEEIQDANDFDGLIEVLENHKEIQYTQEEIERLKRVKSLIENLKEGDSDALAHIWGSEVNWLSPANGLREKVTNLFVKILSKESK